MPQDEKTLRAFVEAGAIKRIRIIANGAFFHVEAATQDDTIAASTLSYCQKWCIGNRSSGYLI